MKDNLKMDFTSHILIKDPESGKIFINKRTNIVKKESDERFNKTNSNRPLNNKE